MKVHSENVPNSKLAKFTFKKAVPTEPELTALDPSFLARLAEVEAKSATITVASGRRFCYFDESGRSDGDPAALLVVVCLHGLGRTKEIWIQPEPVPGIRLVAIDRLGHGGSSAQSVPYLFADGVPEIAELLDCPTWTRSAWTSSTSSVTAPAPAGPGWAICKYLNYIYFLTNVKLFCWF